MLSFHMVNQMDNVKTLPSSPPHFRICVKEAGKVTEIQALISLHINFSRAELAILNYLLSPGLRFFPVTLKQNHFLQ